MALINKRDIEKLLNVQNNTKGALCISIYIPTHRAGHETLNGQDHILFKNKIREARTLLARHDVPDSEIDAYMKPAEELLNDNGFWRHQAEGLAVFITKGFSAHYTLPIAMPGEIRDPLRSMFCPSCLSVSALIILSFQSSLEISSRTDGVKETISKHKGFYV